MKNVMVFKAVNMHLWKDRLMPIVCALALSLFVGNVFAGEDPRQQVNPVYPEVLVPWIGLEEAPQMVDVAYQIVRCAAGEAPSIYLQVFNEGIDVTGVGFTLSITDNATGVIVQHTVASFSIAFGDIIQAECGSSDHLQLKVDVPLGFDAQNMTIDITYN